MLNKDDFVLVRPEPRLLWGIYEELVKLNQHFESLRPIAKDTETVETKETQQLLAEEVTPPRNVIQEGDKEPEKENVGFKYPCKSCGKGHDNKGQVMACHRKKKKEGD